MNRLNRCGSFIRGNLYKPLIAALLLSATAKAQKQSSSHQTEQQHNYDTAYYHSCTNFITTRFYFSKKYSSLTLKGKDDVRDLQYRPNTTLNMGVGFTYGWFTLNLAAGFPFLNAERDARGKTKYLDLQSHLYSRKYSIDLLGEFYRGYYLFPRGSARENKSDWYLRPDIKLTHLGVAAYRIINWKKFSLRAAMLQNEWQHRSAGSLLAGAETYYGNIRADSAIVPSLLADQFNQGAVNTFRYLNISPGAGYAYTLVIGRHFFLTGAATGNIALSFQREESTGHAETTTSVIPGLSYKASTGYNSARWGVSVLWVHNTVQTKGMGAYQINTGNPRLNMVYRFMPDNRLRKKLKLFRAD